MKLYLTTSGFFSSKIILYTSLFQPFFRTLWAKKDIFYSQKSRKVALSEKFRINFFHFCLHFFPSEDLPVVMATGDRLISIQSFVLAETFLNVNKDGSFKRHWYSFFYRQSSRAQVALNENKFRRSRSRRWREVRELQTTSSTRLIKLKLFLFTIIDKR